MYYRRKILLSLLQVSGNQLDKISLQKLLFLFSRQQEVKSYHFVPYKFGCFSFQANADLQTMTKYNHVAPSLKYWKKTDDTNYLDELKPKDKNAIRYIGQQYGSMSKDELVALTYRKYPFYAINSFIARNILTAEELQKVESQRPKQSSETLFTIGYEGVSLEQYLNKLIIHGVSVLCDVRKNSLSMKYGFSKNQLKNACEGVGVTYIHIPEVGIESDQRQQLNTQADYDQLFAGYKSQTLNNADQHKKDILHLLKTKKRVALTCFEANINQCHRKHLAESIAEMQEFNCELKHI